MGRNDSGLRRERLFSSQCWPNPLNSLSTEREALIW